MTGSDRFEAEQRAREWFHGLRLLLGAWPVIRVDGRGFSGFTKTRFDKPFDARFSEMMVGTSKALLEELGGIYAYTESDEISVLLRPGSDLFDRKLEKLVSVSAGIASAAFTHACGEPAHFDSRVWLGTGLPDVVDYFSWRQADATRCALNGWCYWTLRKAGMSAKEAARALEGRSVAEKNELLFAHDINFNEVPLWQRRGIALYWESYEKHGHDPVRGMPVTAMRRRIAVARELPMRDAYRDFLRTLLPSDPLPPVEGPGSE
jgi:tRNA(His) guanylyltransferase